jgi:hypothetical protein
MNKQPKMFYLGVEWVGEQLRAGVFDDRWRLLGKSSRSAKSPRGLGEVLKRMARCALDAIDEADLHPDDITASAILTDGQGAGQTWGPQQVNQLAAHLPPKLGSNLLTASRASTLMWAVHEHELSSIPRKWLGLFSEPEPALYAAERTQPGNVKPMAANLAGGDATASTLARITAAPTDLLAAVKLARPEVLMLIGSAFEDARSPGTQRVSELLLTAGLELPVHTPESGTQAGVWAAARLAARTFVG